MSKDGRPSKEALINKAMKEKKPHHVLDEKLRKERLWGHYILQSMLATIIIFIVLMMFINTPVIVAALGASAFIVFAMPKNVTAKPRNVIGGHLVGIISGAVFALIYFNFGNDVQFLRILAASASVGVTLFIMVVTDTEHPPAGSTALGLTVHSTKWIQLGYYAIFILISALILSGVKHALRHQLKDLV